MKENFKVTHRGAGCFILVQNYHVLNEVFNYCFAERISVKKDYYSVGFWKIKQLKN